MNSQRGNVEIKVRAPKPINLPSLKKEADDAAAKLATESVLTPTILITPKDFNVWEDRYRRNGDEWKRRFDEQSAILDRLREEKKEAERRHALKLEQSAADFQLLIDQEFERVEKEEREREEAEQLRRDREEREREEREEREREEREEREREEREEREREHESDYKCEEPEYEVEYEDFDHWMIRAGLRPAFDAERWGWTVEPGCQPEVYYVQR